MAKRLLLASVLVALIGLTIHLYQTPVLIPKGFTQQWKLEFLFRLLRVAKVSIAAWEGVGLGPNYPISKRIWNDGETVKVFLKSLVGGNYPNLQITDTDFAGVPVRIYNPEGRSNNSPAFIFLHGGGWTIGGIAAYDGYTRKIASLSGIPVVSVEYRLAPIDPYPAGLDDCVAVAKYLLENAVKYGLDPNRIALAGDSAGGNLAAATALRLRDENFSPPLKMQVLIYPAVQAFDMLTPSFQLNKYNPVVDPQEVAIHWLYYLQGHSDNYQIMMKNGHVSEVGKRQMASSHLDISKLPKELIHPEFVPPALDHGNETLFEELQHVLMNPYVNPLIANDLTRLPRTYMFTAQFDVLRDEGVLFAQRLEEAGVNITHRHSDIAFHGILQFHDFIEEGDDYTRELIDFLNEHL